MAKFNECFSGAFKFFRNLPHNFIESFLKACRCHGNPYVTVRTLNSVPRGFLSHKISTEYLITETYNMQDDILQCKCISWNLQT